MKPSSLRPALITAVVFAALLLGALVTIPLLPRTATAVPPIAWTPVSLSVNVATGQTKTVTVTFTPSQAATTVTLGVVPALQPFVQVSPGTLPTITPGQSLTVTLTISASVDAPLGTVQGTLQTRSGGVLAKPLPITLTICRCISANGVSLTYPAHWQLNSAPLDLNGPIALNNFANAYQQGGIVPPGGADIDVTTIPLPSDPLSDFITKELTDAEIDSTVSITVAGNPATKVVYTDTYTPELNYKNVAVYVPHGGLLTKVYLSYRAGDPSEAQFLAAFDQVVGSLTFTP